ncbi:efflux transporter periplasmic adaptor subunit, partial [Campylobacter jejuni]|nr:efflux transporter periplasmic adaptor subunit [Campylobacter jejuni]
HVKQGDLIAQIDKDKQQHDLDITKAQLESAKANLERKKVALEIANKQYQREQKLYAAKASALENLETQKNNYYTLKANVAEL